MIILCAIMDRSFIGKKFKKYSSLLCFIISSFANNAQEAYWQMEVRYDMDIEFDTKKHQFDGTQKLKIINRSPDTLSKLFYHLYFNAFQPNSDMDIRSNWIVDADKRVGTRISKLTDKEIGYHQIETVQQGNKKLKWTMDQTILEVILAKSLLPGDSTEITMEFESQVPIQIRRSGRNNKEGIDYSMAQWYPKLCVYDKNGWHANPYIGREFYGNWGDFYVNIEIDNNYCVAATGYQMNTSDVNCSSKTDKKGKSKWKFFAPNVHDFVWAADPDYVHESFTRKNGQVLHFFYQPKEETKEWKKLPAVMDQALDYIEKNFGPYPYKSYSFIQGGDGGMEYPLATLITGHRNLTSLAGVSIHELMHTWFQMLLATDEAEFPWMDEGFTSYAEYETEQYLKKLGVLPGEKPDSIPYKGSFDAYNKIIESGLEENLTTHADHYHTNYAYGIASYVKGALTMVQLEYLLGKDVARQGLLDYYWKWRYKHPTSDDFFRVMERRSGAELDWFQEYWIETTKTIDYAIDTVYSDGKKQCKLILERVGLFPMPIELNVEFEDGSHALHYIPLDLMRGEKSFGMQKVNCHKSWHWVNPKYEVLIEEPLQKIKKITIDPDQKMADINRKNNVLIIN